MTTDYTELKSENIERYGTDIGRIGPMLLAHRYADRAHFIFELLQNAEDAYTRLGIQSDSSTRVVSFELFKTHLEVSHHGQLFQKADVRGICGIGESTKSEELTTIGRFGIGFKAVYAFTDSPQIHSGAEHFAIDSFVWPRAIDPIALKEGETRFIFPFRSNDTEAYIDIANALAQLNARTLLFLREIEEIHWVVEGGQSGLYMRSKPELFSPNIRKVSLIGEEAGGDVIEESWLIFSHSVRTPEGRNAGFVEIAFALDSESKEGYSIRRIEDSYIVVFFPTIVSANLGFLIQGPYRTTPSRDNIPAHDAWNRYLVEQTAKLLIDALFTLRDIGLLNIELLRSLPLDRSKFVDGAMLFPLFHSVRESLAQEALLPRYGEGYISAKDALLARGQGLRELLDFKQLGQLFDNKSETTIEEIFWLSDSITSDRTPELRQYLMRELKIDEVDPDHFVRILNQSFLEAQTDDWIISLYKFLNGQPSTWHRNSEKPFIRVEDGRHVTLTINGQQQVFLPSSITTDFPTVRRSICQDISAREFLKRFGVTEPDPVDDVMQNVLPKYSEDDLSISYDDYCLDIERILVSFKTDSKARRETLIAALRKTKFVMGVDLGTRAKHRFNPASIYIQSQRLRNLFEGVVGVNFVDDDHSCLQGDGIRELLEACGATRYLQLKSINSRFKWEELAEMRKRAGAANSSSGQNIQDWTLRGLEELLEQLPTLPQHVAEQKSGILWESLCDLESRRGASVFSGIYRWFYYQQHSTSFDAYFVRLLNDTQWVPDGNGHLVSPSSIVFDSIEPRWVSNAFLISIIRFKPPIIETLAREAGFDPEALDLLKFLGLTNADELKKRLGIVETLDVPVDRESPLGDDLVDKAGRWTEPSGKSQDAAPISSRHSNEQSQASPSTDSDKSRTQEDRDREQSGEQPRKSPNDKHSERKAHFVSYVAVGHEEESEPDGLEHEARMALEERAIRKILLKEPTLRRTPLNNPGFDLYLPGQDLQPVKWVEVKAMKDTLMEHPVGLTRTQFEFALRYGSAYWLYIVENAADESSRIIRIQDPAGKAQTFTFDNGWRQIGIID
jgi:hypothetical protein